MPPPGRIRDLGLELLDRQIVDRDGMLAGKVDDLELSFPEAGSGPPFVTAILAGPGALARRLGGRLGRWVESTYARLAEDPTPSRISFGVVKRIGTQIDLTVSREDLDIAGLEDWVRGRVISKIPGAGRAAQ